MENGAGWFSRRNMRLTRIERRLVNSTNRAERTAQTVRTLLRGIALPAGLRCLEVGCGQGAVTRVLVQEFGARAVCTDHDPVELAIARERLADLPADRVEFRQVDARSLPFNDEEFDLVAEFQVWHHIIGGWRDATAEVSRVLRQGGVFLFVDELCLPVLGRLARTLLRLDAVADDTLRGELHRHDMRLQRYDLRFWGMLHCKGVATKSDGMSGAGLN